MAVIGRGRVDLATQDVLVNVRSRGGLQQLGVDLSLVIGEEAIQKPHRGAQQARMVAVLAKLIGFELPVDLTVGKVGVAETCLGYSVDELCGRQPDLACTAPV